MRASSKSTLLGIFLILLCAAAFAQNASSPKPSPAATPHPDFSRMPDLTDQPVIKYHAYDKAPLTFKTSAQYVLVPVIVTDKKGRPIAGLTKEDFRLHENGKEQQISSFEEVGSNLARLAAGNNASPSPSPKQLIIIALDMVNTPIVDQHAARQQLISYLSSNLELDRQYQLVSIENNGLHILHDYTEDTGALIAALHDVQNKFPTTQRVDKALLQQASSTDVAASASNLNVAPGTSTLATFARGEQTYAEALQIDAASSTLRAFQQIAEHVTGVPGRKSLIWVTGSFPFSIDPRSLAVNMGVSFGDYQQAMHLLGHQMISVYPVDVRGVLTLGPDASVPVRGGEGPGSNAFLSNESNRQRDVLDTMRAFSDMTGGKAYVNTNDASNAIRDAVNDGSAYYLLSYPVDQSNSRQGWRNITLKVRNYHVRARKGYFLTQLTADSKDL